MSLEEIIDAFQGGVFSMPGWRSKTLGKTALLAPMTSDSTVKWQWCFGFHIPAFESRASSNSFLAT
jgi:hypothetical protein